MGPFTRALFSYGMHADGIYAGAMAFFGTLSLFPLVLLLITVFSVVIRSTDATQIVVSRVIAFIPGSGDLILSVIKGATSSAPLALGVSVAGLLWSSMGVFMTMGFALNRTWNVPRDRNLIVQYLIAAGLALSVGLVVVASLLLSALANLLYFVATPIGLPLPDVAAITVIGSNLLDFLIVWAAASFLYRAMPNVYVEWRDVLGPAALIALAGGAAKFGFTWYLGAIAHVGRIYGPIAAVAGLMLWLFVASVLLLFGAELSHEVGLQRFGDGKRPPVR